MRKGPYIIARLAYETVRGVRRSAGWRYWTAGIPRVSIFITDAYRFTNYDIALECTGTHTDLRNSDEWKVLDVTGKTLSAGNKSHGGLHNG